MIDENSQKRSLSEISHLFLSSVRDKQTNGAPRPKRIPPGQARVPDLGAPALREVDPGARTVDMTPEEFSGVLRKARAGQEITTTPAARRSPPIAAVLGAHLNGRQFDRVKEYARHLSAIHGRIGLIEIDGSELRLMSFEPGDAVLDPDLDAPESPECHDIAEMADAIEEMNCDVDRWLLLAPNPRTPEAKALLREVGHWVLLSSCDHDGVVSSYRLLKGLAESYRPRLSLALLDATDADESARVYRKLSGVCHQFLNWELADEPAITKSTRVVEHLVLCCRPARDKGQIDATPQWDVVGNFLKKSKEAIATPAEAPSPNKQEDLDPMENTFETLSEAPSPIAQMQANAAAIARPQAPRMAPAAPRVSGPQLVRDTTMDVIDLPVDAGPESILTAILQQHRGDLVECPVRAPMCDGARLAITRDRQLVLLAVTRSGLSDLRAIGQAYRWVSENRSLIAMAVPQFAIDIRNLPGLRLLVDHADMAADILQPILHADHVTVQAYRKVRWGGKTGLFLEAA